MATGASVEAGATGASVGDGQRGARGCMVERRPGLGAGREDSTPDTRLSGLENRDGVKSIG